MDDVVDDAVVVVRVASGRSNFDRCCSVGVGVVTRGVPAGVVLTDPVFTVELLAAPGTGLAGPVAGASFVALVETAALAGTAPGFVAVAFGIGGGVSDCPAAGKPPAP